MAKQPDWAIIYFKNFWALIEGGQVPEEVEKPELDWALLGLLDFWAMTVDEDGGDAAAHQSPQFTGSELHIQLHMDER